MLKPVEIAALGLGAALLVTLLTFFGGHPVTRVERSPLPCEPNTTFFDVCMSQAQTKNPD
jgi:hypothetical protein